MLDQNFNNGIIPGKVASKRSGKLTRWLFCLDKTGNDVFQNKFLEFKIIQNEKYMKYMLEITISTGN